MEGIVVILLVVIGVSLAINYNMAKEFEHIAYEKGYDEKKYFWWTLWLPAFGIPMVIALPDKKNIKKITNAISKLNVGSAETPKAQKQAADQLPEL